MFNEVSGIRNFEGVAFAGGFSAGLRAGLAASQGCDGECGASCADPRMVMMMMLSQRMEMMETMMQMLSTMMQGGSQLCAPLQGQGYGGYASNYASNYGSSYGGFPAENDYNAYPPAQFQNYDGGDDSDSGVSNSASSCDPQAPTQQPSGNVQTWIQQAKQVLQQEGVDTSNISDADLNLIIQHESSGNPDAINETDCNAQEGHPSKGLMQTIDSTFNQYAAPGHHDIWNPVDNIVAGVKYALARYGSIDNVPGVQAVHNGEAYVGY